MQLEGKMVEIGDLQNEGGAIGVVLETSTGERVKIIGLTHSQCRQAADCLGDECTLRISASDGGYLMTPNAKLPGGRKAD
jgi:hypothetical protein